jgi:hypothetical protein
MTDPNLPWDAIAAVGACVTAIVAWWQIQALRAQQKGWETLHACRQYDTDAVLDKALSVVRDARTRGDLAKDPLPWRLEIVTVLNYLEGIATGIAQGFYDKRIVRDHMEPIMKDHVHEFLAGPVMTKLDFKPEYFPNLVALVEAWKVVKPTYKMGLF